MAGITSLQELETALADASSSAAPQICLDAILCPDFPDAELRPAVLLGLSRVEPDLNRAERDLGQIVALQGSDWKSISTEHVSSGVEQLGQEDAEAGLLLRGSGRLAEMKRRIDVYERIKPESQAEDTSSKPAEQPVTSSSTTDVEEMDIDDPWAEGAGEEADSPSVDDPWESTSGDKDVGSSSQAPVIQESPPADNGEDIPLDLSTFISQPIYTSVTTLASSASLHALRLVCERYEETLWPLRFDILSHIPVWVSPVDIEQAGFLPGADEKGKERPWTFGKQPRKTLLDRLADLHVSSEDAISHDSRPTPLLASDLTAWYTTKIEELDTYGLLDSQLAWVQHGAAQSVPGLDALGEDLSLLSRLVYDAHLSPTQHDQWSLLSWRSASESELVSAYLSGSTALTIVDDIRRLVLPYLYVLESRAERAGQADPQLVNRLLHDAILALPLHLALPVFEASKATLPKHERLVKDDMTVARLALACLYGSQKKDIWATMSAIFECLPVWDVSGGDLDSDREATSTTLESIATFVRPTKAGDSPPTPKDLFFFFSPLPFASLSRALDVLDVQLESGEVLARWDTPVQLQFLLQSASNKGEQKDLAERMVRRQSSKSLGEREWWNLWTDMKKLNGGDDALLKGAFGSLDYQEMMSILLGGVLSSGKFDIARRIIKRLQTGESLPLAMLETAVLATSRELYDNADSGNIHSGNMKLAYDCLGVAPSSPAIVREKGFIEATSRLTSFHPFPPLTIRHTQNKLDLIRTIIDSGSGATKHPEIVLDLVDKLGYKGDSAARAEVLGMLGEAAVDQDELDNAWTHCEALIGLVNQSKRSSRRTSGPQAAGDGQIRQVCWKTCLKLGRRPEVDIHRRMTLLGKSIELCPADQISDILSVWREAEEAYLAAGQEAKRRRLAGKVPSAPPAQPHLPTLSVGEGEEERVLGSRTAARAARLAKVALNPLSAKIPHLPGSASPRLASEGFATVLSGSLFRSVSRDSDRHRDRSAVSSPLLPQTGDDSHLSPALNTGDRLGVAAFGEETDAERVSRHAKRAFTRGVGWLLGAEEGEV